MTDDQIKLTKRFLVRLHEIKSMQPFLVRDGLNKFIDELEAIVNL